MVGLRLRLRLLYDKFNIRKLMIIMIVFGTYPEHHNDHNSKIFIHERIIIITLPCTYYIFD